jgi:hypothetical protein
MKEVWKPVCGYEGLYEVSSLGNVKALAKTWIAGNGSFRAQREIILRAHTGKSGYQTIRLCKNGIRGTCKIHRLVAIAFKGMPAGALHINHIDGNKSNNHVSNLEWCTPSENIRHAHRTGLIKCANKEAHPQSKLSQIDVSFIRIKYAKGDLKLKELGLRFNISTTQVWNIINQKNWKTG